MVKEDTHMTRRSIIMVSGLMTKSMELESIHLKEEFIMEVGPGISVKVREV